jgi:hypothetical protein
MDRYLAWYGKYLTAAGAPAAQSKAGETAAGRR